MKNKISHIDVFTKLYESNFWGGEESPESGSGSTKTAAMPYVEAVRNFIETYSIETVLDIGHGDWEMWGSFQFDNVNYVGIDVYENLTNKLNLNNGNEYRSFQFLNAVYDDLPNAELCITKDVLQHLPLNDIETIMRKLSDYPYLIICNDKYKYALNDTVKALRRFLSIRERVLKIKSRQNPFFLKLKRSNSEINTGEHRCIDLSSKLFAKNLCNHKLLQTLDFDGKDTKRPNVVKRIYFYEKQ